MKSVFNVDWLSIYGVSNVWCAYTHYMRPEDIECDSSMTVERLVDYGTQNFVVVPLPHGTKQFAHCYNILPRGANYSVAVVQCCPRAGILNPRAVIIKLANYLLYTENLTNYIDKMLNELYIEAKSVSRLDLAIDFYEFENGYKPEQLIRDYLNGEIIRVGQGVGRVFFAQRQTTDGKTKETKTAISYNGLQFGSKSSIANVYLYNKTRELTEAKSEGHKDKPHIRESWKLNGLNEEERDVWRLEVSLKPEALVFADGNTGELLDFKKWETALDNAQLIFGTYVDKLFKFVLPTDKNITRCKRIKLLSDIPAINRKVVNVKRCSTMSDKIFIKSLVTSLKYSKINNDPKLYRNAIKLATAVIDSCDLEWWYNKIGRDGRLPNELASMSIMRQWLEHRAEDNEWMDGILNI